MIAFFTRDWIENQFRYYLIIFDCLKSLLNDGCYVNRKHLVSNKIDFFIVYFMFEHAKNDAKQFQIILIVQF